VIATTPARGVKSIQVKPASTETKAAFRCPCGRFVALLVSTDQGYRCEPCAREEEWR
jgi:hypothetical protein